uniref:MIP16110p n=1 Tax=Drosophila melanogaster TaxID=7227 RepID=D3DMP7_DROME|nr:MIP16110p [Drosophila melanogaster]
MEPPKSGDPRRRTVERESCWISLVHRWISLEVARRKNRRRASGERASNHLISHLPRSTQRNKYAATLHVLNAVF